MMIYLSISGTESNSRNSASYTTSKLYGILALHELYRMFSAKEFIALYESFILFYFTLTTTINTVNNTVIQ